MIFTGVFFKTKFRKKKSDSSLACCTSNSEKVNVSTEFFVGESFETFDIILIVIRYY